MILTSDRYAIPDGPGFPMSFTDFSLVASDGSPIAELPSQPLGEFGRYGDTGLVGTPLFGAVTRRAGDPTGYWVGTAIDPEIRRYSAWGELEVVARWREAESRTVSDGDAAAALAAELAQASEEDGVQLRRVHSARPVDERFPAYGDIHVDALGLVWVQKYERPDHEGPSQWRVFYSSVVLRATASTPPNQRVMEIGPDYVLTVVEDEFGVEYVHVYSLVRR